MSVAEKSTTEKVQRSPQAQLALKSFLGALYVLVSLDLVFGALPTTWAQLFPQEIVNEFLSGALLLLVSMLVLLALGFGAFLLEKANPQHGLRAGIFVGSLILFAILWVGFSFGNIQGIKDLGDGPGIFLTLAIVVGLLFGVWRIYLLPGFYDFLLALEDQGWFHASSFKPNQGFKVRRATVLGILTLGVCGIITMISHRSLGSDRLAPNNWAWDVPFTGGEKFLPLLYKVHVTVPLFLSAGLLWIAWRVVNWPTFADFLIATEAEINKVSWTTRKRLIQDTIVVLVTVFVLTAFLFAVDILWIKILSNPWIGVLQVDLRAEQLKQQEKSQW